MTDQLGYHNPRAIGAEASVQVLFECRERSGKVFIRPENDMISKVGACWKEVLDASRDVVAYFGISDVGPLGVFSTDGADAGLGVCADEDALGVELPVGPRDHRHDELELGLLWLLVGPIRVREGRSVIQECVLVPLTTRFQAGRNIPRESGENCHLAQRSDLFC